MIERSTLQPCISYQTLGSTGLGDAGGTTGSAGSVGADVVAFGFYDNQLCVRVKWRRGA